jgi:hypothetical protein
MHDSIPHPSFNNRHLLPSDFCIFCVNQVLMVHGDMVRHADDIAFTLQSALPPREAPLLAHGTHLLCLKRGHFEAKGRLVHKTCLPASQTYPFRRKFSIVRACQRPFTLVTFLYVGLNWPKLHVGIVIRLPTPQDISSY